MFIRAIMVMAIVIIYPIASVAQPAVGGLPVDAASSNGLSAAESALLTTLAGRRFHALKGHAELAELIRLQHLVPASQRAEPRQSIIKCAERSLGVPYKRGAHMLGLAEADCVTWTERVLALALTDSWTNAYALSIRLRFKDGDTRKQNLNHYPLADWLVNNSWLLEDITESLQVPTVPLDVYTDHAAIHLDYQSARNKPFDSNAEVAGLAGPELSMQTSYVAAADIRIALRRMQSGDVIFFIAEYPGKLGEPASPRCIHQAFLAKDKRQAWLLHCVQPRATKDLFDRFVESRIPNSRFLGIKVARVRQDAFTLVTNELASLSVPPITPTELDERHGTAGAADDGTIFVRCTRAPDRTMTIGQVEYGIINIAPNETLSLLFKGQWKRVYELPINTRFRQRFANPDRISPGVVPILYPLDRASDAPTPGGSDDSANP